MALNNPLYITDHRDGGYGQKSDYEKERETIFEGVQHGQATGVGTLCEYTSIDGADKADQSETFEVTFKVSKLIFGATSAIGGRVKFKLCELFTLTWHIFRL